MHLRVYMGVDSSPVEEGVLEEGESIQFTSTHDDNAERLLSCFGHMVDEGMDWVFVANDHTFVVPEVYLVSLGWGSTCRSRILCVCVHRI